MLSRRMLLVARREVLENVRTKGFWIGLLLLPVLLSLSIGVPIWLRGRSAVRDFAVIDRSGWLGAAVAVEAERSDLERLFRTGLRLRRVGKDLSAWPDSVIALIEDGNADPAILARRVAAAIPGDGHPEDAEVLAWWRGARAAKLRTLETSLARARFREVSLSGAPAEAETAAAREVGADRLFAFFVIGERPEAGPAGCRYVSKNLTDEDLPEWFGRLATEAVRARRFGAAGVDPAAAGAILAPLAFQPRKVDETGAETDVAARDTARQWLPVAFVYLLWLAVFVAAQMLLSNTIEEKSGRILEVLLSSVSPLELMSGKIAGIASTGLIVLGSWVAFILVAVKVGPSLLGVELPFDLGGLVSDPLFLASFLFYFVFGYVLIAAIVAGIGSLCTTIKEAQNLWTPVMLVLIIPLLSMEPIGRDPNGPLARILSFIPPFTPFVMMNRAAGPPPLWEYLATTVIMIASTVLVFFGAAKVFRVGVLMTGKPPRLREILRLLRAPVRRTG